MATLQRKVHGRSDQVLLYAWVIGCTGKNGFVRVYACFEKTTDGFLDDSYLASCVRTQCMLFYLSVVFEWVCALGVMEVGSDYASGEFGTAVYFEALFQVLLWVAFDLIRAFFAEKKSLAQCT